MLLAYLIVAILVCAFLSWWLNKSFAHTDRWVADVISIVVTAVFFAAIWPVWLLFKSFQVLAWLEEKAERDNSPLGLTKKETNVANIAYNSAITMLQKIIDDELKAAHNAVNKETKEEE